MRVLTGLEVDRVGLQIREVVLQVQVRAETLSFFLGHFLAQVLDILVQVAVDHQRLLQLLQILVHVLVEGRIVTYVQSEFKIFQQFLEVFEVLYVDVGGSSARVLRDILRVVVNKFRDDVIGFLGSSDAVVLQLVKVRVIVQVV